MEKIVRPESMERMTTPELAKNFIEEQIAEIKKQVGNKKVLLALSASAVCRVRRRRSVRCSWLWVQD